MARVRIPGTGRRATPDNYHSDDPRQTDLVAYLGEKVGWRPDVPEAPAAGRQDCPATAGRPAVEQPESAEPSGERSDVDALVGEARRATGGCLALSWGAPGGRAAHLVCVSWESAGRARTAFFESAAVALYHVLEYERIRAESGAEAAELFHERARCRTESEAVAAAEERAGVVRRDALADERGLRVAEAAEEGGLVGYLDRRSPR